jgi:hypothetical protein
MLASTPAYSIGQMWSIFEVPVKSVRPSEDEGRVPADGEVSNRRPSGPE